MTMSNTKKANPGKSKATFIPKAYDWGLYFWKLPSGHLFRDEDGNMLNIPSMKNDISKMSELRKAANHYVEPEGEPWFYPGIKRATDEEFSEQQERVKSGLIPNLNDLGSVYDAQQSLLMYGDKE
jgi:hypothetical protein